MPHGRATSHHPVRPARVSSLNHGRPPRSSRASEGSSQDGHPSGHTLTPAVIEAGEARLDCPPPRRSPPILSRPEDVDHLMRGDRADQPPSSIEDRHNQEMIPPRDPGYGLGFCIDGHAEHVGLRHELHRQGPLDIEQLSDGNDVQQAALTIDDIDHRRVRGALTRWQSLDCFSHRHILADRDEFTRHDATG